MCTAEVDRDSDMDRNRDETETESDSSVCFFNRLKIRAKFLLRLGLIAVLHAVADVVSGVVWYDVVCCMVVLC